MGRAADPATDPETTLYVAERLLATVRDDVARADTKAAVLLSGALAMPALLLGGRWSPQQPAGPWLAPLFLGGAVWAAGVALLVWAILPRTRTSRATPGVTYFADAHRGQDSAALLRAVAAAGEDRVGWLMTQFVDMSVILTAKYRCLRWGICCLAPGFVLCAAALTAGA
ncbi:Pycsar system effector family protein [Streptomyces sp.]|uniref:Pycsar system effector family protein n=1 Tax=Streptomyces sp. TaxID=1931 RepID=UPI002F41A507